MSKPEWGRPGIIPGLQESSERRFPSTTNASTGVLGYVGDPHDSKTLVIGDGNSLSNSECQKVTKPEDELRPTKAPPTIQKTVLQIAGDVIIRGCRIMDDENMCNADILIRNGKISAIGENLGVCKNAQEIDATNLVVSPGLVDFSATSHAFSSRLGNEGMADPKLIREATERAVLSGVTTIIDTVYTDEGQPPLSAIAAYLQALQTTYVHCNVSVRAGIRQLTVSSLSDIETLIKRHHVHSFMLAIPENDQHLCDRGNPESTILYAVLSACRAHGIVPTIGLDKINGTRTHNTEGDQEPRLASIAITIAKLAGCPIVLSPVRSMAVMQKIYSASRDVQPLYVYADFAAYAFVNDKTMHSLAPYVAADGNVILSSGEAFLLPSELATTTGGSWIQKSYDHIVSRGWANERHVTSGSSKRPAQLSGLYPRKGRLSIGADADLVLWPESDRSRPLFTLVGGRVATQFGKLRGSTQRDWETDSAVKTGYVIPGQTPCVMLAAVQERMKELGKMIMQGVEPTPVLLSPMRSPVRQPTDNSNKSFSGSADELAKRLDGTRVTAGGDVAAGLPTREMRTIASQYKRDSLASTFKFSGEQQGDDRPARPNVKIWQSKLDSTRPY